MSDEFIPAAALRAAHTQLPPSPQPQCRRHPDGDVGDSCGACYADRERFKTWAAHDAQARAQISRQLTDLALQDHYRRRAHLDPAVTAAGVVACRDAVRKQHADAP